MGAVHALPSEAACEVDVHDVKAARAEAEVVRLHVDDHIVALLARADQADIGDRSAALAGE